MKQRHIDARALPGAEGVGIRLKAALIHEFPNPLLLLQGVHNGMHPGDCHLRFSERLLHNPNMQIICLRTELDTRPYILAKDGKSTNLKTTNAKLPS